MERKILTWAEVRELAIEHYNDGGDGILECWSERDYINMINDFGGYTREELLECFEDYRANSNLTL